MPRRKKKVSTTNLLLAGQAIFAAPMKLLPQLDKTINRLTKQESKQNKVVSSTKNKLAKLEKNIHSLKQTTLSRTQKKKLTVTTKSWAQQQKLLKLQSKTFAETTQDLNAHKELFRKLSQLNKQLAQFEKEWTKQEKQSKPKLTSSRKEKPVNSSATQKIIPIKPETDSDFVLAQESIARETEESNTGS